VAQVVLHRAVARQGERAVGHCLEGFAESDFPTAEQAHQLLADRRDQAGAPHQHDVSDLLLGHAPAVGLIEYFVARLAQAIQELLPFQDCLQAVAIEAQLVGLEALLVEPALGGEALSGKPDLG
jgi:hypothetical protein